MQESRGQINSIDFHRQCDLLVTAGSDDRLNIYSTSDGKHLQQVPSQKYGCQNVVWTHKPDQVIFATEKVWWVLQQAADHRRLPAWCASLLFSCWWSAQHIRGLIIAACMF
jgi:hypothetical protein